MMRDVWTGPWALVLFFVVAATRLPAQETLLDNVAPTSALILLKPPAAHADNYTVLPNRGGAVFLTLLMANGLKEDSQPARARIDSTGAEASLAPTPKPMTMLAISCYDQVASPEAAQSFSISCRTEGSLSNATPTGRIVMKGVITQDVVSNGKILLLAGSKVSGIGRVDPDSGRIEAKGDWSVLTENQEIRVHAEALDAEGGFHGIPGRETSFENQLSQRQAVARDGRYCFLPDKTPFVLSITGKVTTRVLQPLESSE